jgi:hypothetical protein
MLTRATPPAGVAGSVTDRQLDRPLALKWGCSAAQRCWMLAGGGLVGSYGAFGCLWVACAAGGVSGIRVTAAQVVPAIRVAAAHSQVPNARAAVRGNVCWWGRGGGAERVSGCFRPAVPGHAIKACQAQQQTAGRPPALTIPLGFASQHAAMLLKSTSTHQRAPPRVSFPFFPFTLQAPTHTHTKTGRIHACAHTHTQTHTLHTYSKTLPSSIPRSVRPSGATEMRQWSGWLRAQQGPGRGQTARQPDSGREQVWLPRRRAPGPLCRPQRAWGARVCCSLHSGKPGRSTGRGRLGRSCTVPRPRLRAALPGFPPLPVTATSLWPSSSWPRARAAVVSPRHFPTCNRLQSTPMKRL